MSSPVLDFFQSNGWRVPLLLVYVVGIVLAAITWRRHPLASALSLAGFGLLLISNAASAVLFGSALRQTGGADRETLLTVGNAVFTLVSVGGWVLILIALFARRPLPAPAPRFEKLQMPDEGRPVGGPPPDTAIRPVRG